MTGNKDKKKVQNQTSSPFLCFICTKEREKSSSLGFILSERSSKSAKIEDLDGLWSVELHTAKAFAKVMGFCHVINRMDIPDVAIIDVTVGKVNDGKQTELRLGL